MIDIEESELAGAIMQELKMRIEYLRQTENYGPRLLHNILSLLLDVRQRCRNQGIKFPKMVPLILPSIGLIELWRADLDRAAIEIKVVNVVALNRDVEMVELAEAVHAAYPEFQLS